MSKVRGPGGEELPHLQGQGQWPEELPQVQGKEQRLCFAGAAVKRYPTKGKRNPSKMVGTEREHQRADRLKTQSQTTSQSYHRTTVLSNSMKLSHAMWGHPRQLGHGGKGWQNVVHQRRKWQTTSVFLPENPMNSMKRQNDRTLKDELPRLGGAQYAIGDHWRNNSRKNEGMEPKL